LPLLMPPEPPLPANEPVPPAGAPLPSGREPVPPTEVLLLLTDPLLAPDETELPALVPFPPRSTDDPLPLEEAGSPPALPKPRPASLLPHACENKNRSQPNRGMPTFTSFAMCLVAEQL